MGSAMPPVLPFDDLAALAAQARETLFVALISDVLDGLGFRDQALPARIRPLDEGAVLFGRARTGLYREVYEVPVGRNPYALEIALIDDLKPGDVAVLACGTSGRIAPWGGLLTTAARARGAAGCLTDGCVRDIRAIRSSGFAVFHGGISPLDSKGRGEIVEVDVAVEVAGVHVAPGDLVFGDADGAVVIPRAIERETLTQAMEKLAGETRTEEALARGERLADVFARYGIL
jgi:4-hydroxy-4-methyl-2-oxoglutarate aldolase